MTAAFDVVVLGGGPAGMRAAIAARQHGLTVALVDEGQRPGGQVYRAPFYPIRLADLKQSTDLGHGEQLRAELDQSGATIFARHRAWFASTDRRVACFGPGGPVDLQGRALIVATGTTERVIPVPGITTPGVIGLAAATILLKAQAVVPPGPTVVAGVGPLLYAVAASLLKAGGTVAAVVDLLRPAEWGGALPGLLSRPDLVVRGLRWMAALKRSGVPIHRGATVTAVNGSDHVVSVDIAKVRKDWSPMPDCITVAAGSVAIGHGLTPATEFARLLGIPHHFSAERGGWVPRLDEDGKAADGLYIAGDCAGISGAAAAEWAGTLVGAVAARDLGALLADGHAAAAREARTSLARAARFGGTISRMMALRPGLIASVTPNTIVCRCEDITRARVAEVAARGGRHVNQLKSTTRCGMGPCQGRSCGEAAAEIMAAAAGLPREQVGIWTARAPLRPISADLALGDYEYDDIPKPPLLPA
jgi:NADPH-dependent 2,4-dienoyl-CoA reductase/sulfur reductase-like enzyme